MAFMPDNRHPHLPPGREPGPQSLRVGKAGFRQAMGGAGGVLGGVASMVGGELAAPHLDVTVEPIELKRGEELRVVVAVGDPAQAGRRLEVDLLCTEWYDYRARDSHNNSRRVTRAAKAYGQTQAIEQSAGRHELAFTIPEQAPFSHEGEVVSFSWKVSVREERENRIDPVLERPIWVLP